MSLRGVLRGIALASAAVATPAAAGVRVGDGVVEVVDMHLHPGRFGQMPIEGRAFVTAALPPFVQLYAPALVERLTDPYAEHVGIQAQTALAGVDHAVLYAVYAQHSSGYLTNEQVEALLDDPRNRAADGSPWAWGMASVNLDDWDDGVAIDRLAALESFIAARPERFIGIKLAHAHQGVAFDDPRYHAIYDVAARHGVPVVLHTGFSPFPNTRTEPAYYDPAGLESVIASLDGRSGARVDFVLSHVGQGDARSVEHALALAEAYPNVHLELSALSRPLLLDGTGAQATDPAPQYPAVLGVIKARGLVGRALFATDGPQYSGMIRSYLGRILAGLEEAGYTSDEIAAVLGGNFRRLFLTR